MIKALFYKEWIKIRWYALLSFVVMAGFAFYNLMRVVRVAELKGAGHIWEVMLQKDVIFLNSLQYIPLLVGIGMALVQFAPEMYHKSLKLTLHLPYSPLKLTYGMLSAGFAVLVVGFALQLFAIHLCLDTLLAVELRQHILYTVYVWFLAGVASYFLVSWITLEPTWKRRIANAVIAALVLKIYFLSNTPEAYNPFLPWLTLYTLLTASLSWISVERFKAGKQ